METEKLRFRLNWKVTLLTLVLLPVLVSLGFWQLSRAEEKQTIQQSWEHQQALPPEPLEHWSAGQANRRVVVSGEFDDRAEWLLENRILDGRLGYEVVMPLRTASGLLLVNRGWVAAGEYRADNPVIDTPRGELRLTGTLKTPSDSRFIEQSDTGAVSWPYRLLELDTALMSAQLGEPLDTRVLLLDADSPAALTVNWLPVNMSAAKHQGYAVQWFAMALALSLLWLVSNTNIVALLRPNK